MGGRQVIPTVRAEQKLRPGAGRFTTGLLDRIVEMDAKYRNPDNDPNGPRRADNACAWLTLPGTNIC